MNRAAIACALVALAGDARADDKGNKARADALYEKGTKSFKDGEYTAAIATFREAYELVHDPVYLFNLAQSYRKVLDCVAADEHYRRYLAEATDADAAQRVKVEKWLRELAPCVEQRRHDADAARRLEQADAERRAAEAQRKRSQVAADRGAGLRRTGWIVAGTGLVLAGVGVGFGIHGQRIETQLREECGAGCDWTRSREDADKAGARANIITAVGTITGGAALATGLALYFVGRSRSSVEHLQLAPTAGGASVSARFDF